MLLDCEASFEDINLAVVAFSNFIYLVATPEIGAVRDLSRYVDGLIQNEQATKKLQVIINRYSSHEAVTISRLKRRCTCPSRSRSPITMENWFDPSISANRCRQKASQIFPCRCGNGRPR